MLLWYIYILLIIINLTVAIIRWPLLRTPIKWLFGLLSWVLLVEILREFGNEKWKPFLTHLNISIELLIQFSYFRLVLNKKKRLFLFGGVIFYYTALFLAWCADNTFFMQSYFLDGVFMDLCITLWTALFFYELIQKPLQYNINRDGNFWINCGNILYYPGTMFLFGLNSYMKNVSPDLWNSLRPLNYGLNLTIYALYLVAFSMDKKRKSKLL